MSATPYECLEYINNYDKSGVIHHFNRNYSYLNIKNYLNLSELNKTILKSIHANKEKWLIFLDNIKSGEDYKKELINNEDNIKIEIFNVNAKSKEDEQYKKILRMKN